MEQYTEAIGLLEKIVEKDQIFENRQMLARAYERAGRVYLFKKNFTEAASKLDHCVRIRESLAEENNSVQVKRELRTVYEFAGAAFEQTEREKGKEYILKYCQICKEISTETQFMEDYMELAGSYDYLISISDDEQKKLVYVMQMKNIYEQILNQMPDNAEAAERLDYAEKLFVDYQIRPELARVEQGAQEAAERGDHKEAAKCFEKASRLKVAASVKQSHDYEEIDSGIEYLHRAAGHYKDAGNLSDAVRCCEAAIKLREDLVKSTKGHDVAKSRLGYSYMMTVQMESSEQKKKEYAQKAYEIFRELAEKHPDEDNFIKFRDWMRTFI